MEPFIGQIMTVGFNFAPQGWAKCDGQLLSISQNEALFSLLGTIYGGDGRTTFALPDLRGRVAMGDGQGPGLTSRRIGEKSGSENSSSHSLRVYNGIGNQNQITEDTNALAITGIEDARGNPTFTGNAFSTNLPNKTISPSSGESTNIQPYQVVNYVIALTGIFPSRD
ncbi:MAG: Microcystin dependent protein [uncultured Sulfurovum sp.]|uniref:Microcystin dependent protein n=1 Tax=uncultured Sulfurovum sp. TaxID=269237 RepID=A0A6S6TSP4_9BACT|nr:MAG: Microcystin dependent protein [uncultured Sulfurovum sp.]